MSSRLVSGWCLRATSDQERVGAVWEEVESVCRKHWGRQEGMGQVRD